MVLPDKDPFFVGVTGVCDFALQEDTYEKLDKIVRSGPLKALVNELGIRRIILTFDGIDDMVACLLAHGAELVGEVVQYENSYRLAYVRGPEGIIVGLAEQLK